MPHSSLGAWRAPWLPAHHCSTRPIRPADCCTANPTACPASSPIATAKSSCCNAFRRRRALARCTRRRVDRDYGCTVRVRALRCRRARAGRAAGTHRPDRGQLPDGIWPSSKAAWPTASTSCTDRRPASTSTSGTTAASLRRYAAGRRVLNAFCYTGGFSLAALAGGASSVTPSTVPAEALEMARAQSRPQPARSMPPAPLGPRPTCSPNCAGCAMPAPPST